MLATGAGIGGCLFGLLTLRHVDTAAALKEKELALFAGWCVIVLVTSIPSWDPNAFLRSARAAIVVVVSPAMVEAGLIKWGYHVLLSVPRWITPVGGALLWIAATAALIARLFRWRASRAERRGAR
ncbi:MAG TPA: hypothetical protein VK968_15225 [Roseimicrobium sp.]|nr:hypothetical protein [Roseimicrobium sp.]